jgi:hypothetical protein
MNTARVALVLKTGGEYGVQHAQVLARQIQDQLPFHEIICLSDVIVPEVHTILLQHGWPGWWSKMEVCRPDIYGDILYFDLDTVITAEIAELTEVNRLTLLRDFYNDGTYKGRRESLNSGVMYLPESERAAVWEAWIAAPQQHMRRIGHLGDQAFLNELWHSKAARWQDLLPGRLVSYKVHVNPTWKTGGVAKIPDAASVICFHGKPRPWITPKFQHLYKAA